MRLHLLAFQRKLLNQNSPPERQTSPPSEGPIVPAVRSVSDILAPFALAGPPGLQQLWPGWCSGSYSWLSFCHRSFPPVGRNQEVQSRLFYAGVCLFSEPFRSLCGSGKAPWFIRVGMDLCVCLIALHEWKQEPAREKAWRLDAVVAGLFWRVSEEVVFKYIKISH